MKKLFYIILSLCILAGGCQKYDDTELRSDIDDLKDRVETLESLCQNMNKDIVALKALVEALQNHDYIVSVTPIYEGGNEIGYKILFGSGKSITIYHGKDGADGADGQNGKDGVDGANGQDGKDGADGTNGQDGKDGITPVIGVRQDADGVYYWTLNGDWLLDDNGEKIKAVGEDGKDGSNGTNGSDGRPGRDGVTPQLKIEGGMWYVSYDNGSSWHEVGPATGEQGPQGDQGETGQQGPQGPQGDSLFRSVTQDESNVYFTLADGTRITIPKESLCPVKMTLGHVTATTATLNGTVDVKSVDLKVTIHYSTSADLTVYDSESVSQTMFSGNTFNIVLNNLAWNTQYYYFVAVIYNGKTYYSEVNAFMTAADTINLSSTGTANSYIVSCKGLYSFPAVKGNSPESVGQVSSVEVLWESFGTDVTPNVGDLVKNVSYNNGEITFRTADTFKEGNAVIAAKNASGTILWSWHIWFTDQPEGQVYYDNAGTMMDRNLGATSATPRDVGALGLLYQWGRKDPFLGYSSIYEDDYDDYEIAKSTITWPSPVRSSTSVGTIEYAIAHPTTVIYGNSENYDWYYTDLESTDNTRWTTSDKPKSIYDPCPSGWRVPDGGKNGVWAKACGDDYFECNFKKVIEGINLSGWFGSASTIWYPFTDDGDSGYYWSASPYHVRAYSMYLRVNYKSIGEVDVTYEDSSRSSRQSVRCIQE